MVWSTAEETVRRLRVLAEHLDGHPDLPVVARAGTYFLDEKQLEVQLPANSPVAGFLAWCATLGAAQVQVAEGYVVCRGTVGGYRVEMFSSLAELLDWPVSEPMPVAEFRVLLAHAGVI